MSEPYENLSMSPPRITHLDHLVLTVRNIHVSCEFYRIALGMTPMTFGEGRWALQFGTQKINLHELGHEFEPKAASPKPGSADLCFVSDTPLADVIEHLQRIATSIELGPVSRTGARGAIQSIYIRDPDGNLIEISTYV